MTLDEAAIERIFAEKYTAFERDRALRQAAMEEARSKRTRRINRQFWFLFVVLFASFVLLGYRTEVTASALRTYIHQACENRNARVDAFNQGRAVLIKVIMDDPQGNIPPDQRAAVQKRLEDGLLLPTEDCDKDPAA